MSQPETVPEPWLSFLRELDKLATSMAVLHCIGGFVVTMAYGLERTTGDLDVLEVAPKAARSAFAKVALRDGELHQKYKVYLDQVSIARAPYDYESRLREMFPGTFRSFYLVSSQAYSTSLPFLRTGLGHSAYS